MELKKKIWKKAKKIIPSGNSFLSKNPTRFPVKNWPIYFSKAKKCQVWDLFKKKYYDFSYMGVGTNVLGYADSDIDNAVIKEIKKSNMSTLNTKFEVDFAEKILNIHSWAGMAKFARTGAEANALALRVARAYTGKDKIIICGYHGWHDWYLSAKLSTKYNDLETHLYNDLKIDGVFKGLKNSSYSIKQNDIISLERIINKDKNIACLIMEVERLERNDKKFLNAVRKLCNQRKIVLIFDECTTGFRENFGGAHLRYKVNPDIAMFGKAIGNGYAITSIVGKKKIMKCFNNTFSSSTFWSEKIGFVAGIATLNKMKKIKSWEILRKRGTLIKKSLKKIALKNNLQIFFSESNALINFSIKGIDNDYLNTFILDKMLKKGFLAGNAIYVSVAHTENLIKKYIKNMDSIFKDISAKH
jgi:glutamate-1-semialdehyde 2,1-aminomutase